MLMLALSASPGGLASSGAGRKRLAECRQVQFEGEVKEGERWSAAIGEGWEFRVLPIAGTPKPGSPAAGHGYSGWDLAVDRERGGGYPDALLLATPPYGSVNQREIGTTYGLRAQDAIAWNPRQFHFLVSVAKWRQAREFYAALMPEATSDGRRRDGPEGGRKTTEASRALLELATGVGGAAGGVFEILDAKLVPGVADPVNFARAWAAHLSRVPHTYEQDGSRPGGSETPLGELRWIRFRTTLTLPPGWKFPPELRSEAAKCAE